MGKWKKNFFTGIYKSKDFKHTWWTNGVKNMTIFNVGYSFTVWFDQKEETHYHNRIYVLSLELELEMKISCFSPRRFLRILSQ